MSDNDLIVIPANEVDEISHNMNKENILVEFKKLIPLILTSMEKGIHREFALVIAENTGAIFYETINCLVFQNDIDKTAFTNRLNMLNSNEFLAILFKSDGLNSIYKGYSRRL